MSTKSTSARLGRTRLGQLDERLADLTLPNRPVKGWVRTIRNALGITQKQLGRRLSITQQAVGDLERQEIAGGITLATLAKTAEQMGCELKYVLAPKTSLDDFIGDQARHRAKQKLMGVNASQSLEDASLTPKQMLRSIEDLANELKLTRSRDLWDEA